MRLDAQQLRNLEEKKAMGQMRKIKRHPLYFILENIYDTYNIGGLFRLADALAAEKIYLVGETETPPNSRIKKASIGTYKIVPWEYKKTVGEAIEAVCKTYNVKREMYNVKRGTYNVKRNNENSPTKTNTQFINNKKMLHVVAVEQHPKALNYTEAVYRLPLALIFGNESYGVLPETLKFVDQIVEIPMWGINKSLNVIVAAAIVGYWIINSVGR